MASQWHGNPAACLKSWENSCIHFVSNAFWPCARLNRCPWSYPTRNIPKSKIPTKIPTAIFGTLPTCLVICLLITDNIYWLETVLYKVIGWFIQLYNYRSISEDTIKSQEIIRINHIRIIVGEIKKRCIRMLKH